MEQPLISVIVPVYKAENYLEQCVESIRNQTYPNLEILLIDDGSPDRSGAMCDAYAAQDPRIRVFHKPNGGQSSARNLGLDNMTGEYVAFVDSDDWIERTAYEKMLELALAHHAQIVCCGMLREYADGRSVLFDRVQEHREVRVLLREDALRENLRNAAVTYSPCDKLYEKNIFSDIRMTVGKIYEDMEMIPRCIERADRIVCDPAPYYHYRMTQTSTIRGKFTVSRFAEVDVALAKAEDYKIRRPELYGDAYARYLAVCLYAVHASYGVRECAPRRRELVRILREPCSGQILALLSRNERIKLRCLRLNSGLYEIMMKVYDRKKKD